jgi:hypothetical protein
VGNYLTPAASLDTLLSRAHSPIRPAVKPAMVAFQSGLVLGLPSNSSCAAPPRMTTIVATPAVVVCHDFMLYSLSFLFRHIWTVLVAM